MTAGIPLPRAVPAHTLTTDVHVRTETEDLT